MDAAFSFLVLPTWLVIFNRWRIPWFTIIHSRFSRVHVPSTVVPDAERSRGEIPGGIAPGTLYRTDTLHLCYLSAVFNRYSALFVPLNYEFLLVEGKASSCEGANFIRNLLRLVEHCRNGGLRENVSPLLSSLRTKRKAFQPRTVDRKPLLRWNSVSYRTRTIKNSIDWYRKNVSIPLSISLYFFFFFLSFDSSLKYFNYNERNETEKKERERIVCRLFNSIILDLDSCIAQAYDGIYPVYQVFSVFCFL